MSRVSEYAAVLSGLTDWEPYLLRESGLPGPRGNLELAAAAADLGRREQFERWVQISPAEAPVNHPGEFLVFCGAVGFGRLAAQGDRSVLPGLRSLASDPRWRVREGVATGLQRLGRADMAALLEEMRCWARGNWLEMRAAAAALCEPDLLRRPDDARAVLDILDRITTAVQPAPDRRAEDFRVLRQGLAYCWSVAVAALPEEGKTRMERWISVPDEDIAWVMRENLKKNRLARMDGIWVKQQQARLGVYKFRPDREEGNNDLRTS